MRFDNQADVESENRNFSCLSNGAKSGIMMVQNLGK